MISPVIIEENVPDYIADTYYVAFECRETYPITGNEYWTEYIEGPYRTIIGINQRIDMLIELSESGDVRNPRRIMEF